MPTLRRWLDRELDRLEAESKSALAGQFRAFMAAFFGSRYDEAFEALPGLHRLAETFDEAAWRLTADYYAAFMEIYWRGELAAGLDRLTRAVVQAHKVVGEGSPLELALREWLLYAWINTDAPGYARDVLAATQEIPAGDLPEDLNMRFGLLRALGLANSGSPQEAMELQLTLLASMDWPTPYRDRLRGSALVWVGRLEEALECYESAVRSYEGAGQTIEGNSARLAAGETLIKLGWDEEALDTLRAALSSAERQPNRHYSSVAYGLIGMALAHQGRHEDAITWLAESLRRGEGLGWLRRDAEMAIERVEAMRALGGHAEWEAAVEQARQVVGRLRSTDLGARLASILGEG